MACVRKKRTHPSSFMLNNLHHVPTFDSRRSSARFTIVALTARAILSHLSDLRTR